MRGNRDLAQQLYGDDHIYTALYIHTNIYWLCLSCSQCKLHTNTSLKCNNNSDTAVSPCVWVCMQHALHICIKILCFFHSNHTFRLVFEVPALASFTLAFQHLQFFFHLSVCLNAAMLLRMKYSIWNSVLCRFASWNFTKEIFTVTVWMQCIRFLVRSFVGWYE